ncbi:MAG: L,D-transpeptidase family protein [Clostridia bacterium]|nr:L,D-transpeptidase family protein [Clostridia bacterium]
MKPSPTGEVTIIIDTFRRTLIVMNNNKPYAQFPVAIGKYSTPSPIGNWKIINKGTKSSSAFGTRWIGLNVPWGVYGIHGTDQPWSIGSMASHGCFRMFNKDIETLYLWTKYGTSVVVIGNPFGYMSGGYKNLAFKDRCSAVTFIQEKLWRKGLYKGNPDGIYGVDTEKAIIEFQKMSSLEKTGEIGYRDYEALGIRNNL